MDSRDQVVVFLVKTQSRVLRFCGNGTYCVRISTRDT